MKKNATLIRFVLAFMKFSGLQIFLIFLFSSVAIASPSETLGQDILEERLSLNAADQKIKDVLTTIEGSVRVKFSYNPEAISIDKQVSFNYQNAKLGVILKEVLTDANLSFEVVGDYIVITEGSSPEDALSSVANYHVFTVSGTVRDDQAATLPGVNVIVKGTTVGTTTDANGAYTLNVSEGTETLVFTFIGFSPQEVQIQNRSVIDVTMEPDVKSLQEVVVIGYGSVEKKDVTGAVGSITSDVITSTTTTHPGAALQGRIAGVNVERSVGRPGGGIQITVRGLGSINNGANPSPPLYVIDGIPTSEGLNDINPADIESIDVLKDASATAIYGSRGANGVVIVTTKKGKEGRISIQYDGNYGVRVAANLPDMMNGPEYVQWRTDWFANRGLDTSRGNAQLFTAEEWDIIDRGAYTDWIDLVLRTGMQTSNTLTASGGDDRGTFSVGIGQLKEEGTVPGQDFVRYNMHLSVNRKFLSKWEAGGSIYFTKSIQNQGSYETLRSTYRQPPVANPYDANGKPRFFSYRNDFATNPLFEWEKDGEIREVSRNRAFGNIYLEVKPLSGLTLRSQLAPQVIFHTNGEYYGQFSKAGAGTLANTIANFATNNTFAYVLDNIATYVKDLGNHDVNLSVIHSIQYEQWEGTFQAARNFPFNSKWHNLDAVPLANITASQTDYSQRTLASITGRLQYSFNDKYLFTATGRYDGSSRLAEGNKWAFFPSAAFAWRISEEGFLKGVGRVSNLKLRLTYGVSGNDAVSNYGTQANVSQRLYDFNGSVATSYYKSGLANYNLTWEKTAEVNIGLDYGFLQDRISGSIDVYRQDSKDLIMRRQLPETTGWTDVFDNVGWVRNSGIEFALNSVNIQRGNFSWSTGLIFDSNRNEIVELYGAKKDDVGNRWFIGQPVQVNYDYEFAGIWQLDQADLANKYGQKPGQIRVSDLDDNGVINANDRKIIGQKTPKWSGSITNTVKYKNWDFSVYVYTRQGEQLQTTFRSSFVGLEGNYNQLDVDYWTPTNPSNEYFQPGNRGPYFDAFRYRDVSFVRVGNISLGYSLPASVLDKLKLKRLRVYGTAMNPFTFTSYEGFDPEWADENTWGEATGFSTYLFGVNLAF
jgi:TonB-dependent starch-binding outer membrane protein SusC